MVKSGETGSRPTEDDRGRPPPERSPEHLRAAAEEAGYRILAETAADAIITIDEESTIVSANPAAGDAFGYSTDEMVGRSLTEFIPPRFREPHRAGMRRYLQSGVRNVPWRGLELPGLRRDGSEILFEVSFGERQIEDRRYFTGTMRDITERKRTERMLASQFATARVLAHADSVADAIPAILEGIAESLD